MIFRPRSPYARGSALLLVGAVLSLAGRLRADDPPPIPSDPVYVALKVDGTTASGKLRKADEKGITLGGTAAEIAVPIDGLVKLTRQGDPAPAPPDGPLVLFPSGDRLRAQIEATTETALETQPAILGGDTPLSVPLDSLLAILLSPPSDPSAREALIEPLATEPRKSEVLFLTNDDRHAGGFVGLTAEKVGFQRDSGPAETDRARVAAIAFDPRAAKYPEPEDAPWFELTFADGSRLGAKSWKLDGGSIAFDTRFGAKARVPLGWLVELRVVGGRASYLSERKEVAAEYVGYLGEHRKTYGRDRAVDGRTLRLGGRPYDRGLGTQSRTLLAYRIKPTDGTFQATVGLDDRAGPLGSVVFRVLVDGKERAATPPMTARDAPRTLSADLSGGRVLILATEFGDRGDVQDLADWAEARIIQEPAK